MPTLLPLETPPLETRAAVARPIAAILLVYAFVTLTVTSAGGGPFPVGLLAVTTAAPVLALLWIALGGLRRVQDPRRLEAVLGLFAVVCVVSPLITLFSVEAASSTPLAVLPLVLLASGLVADVRLHLVLTLVAGMATALLAPTLQVGAADTGEAVGASFMALVTLAVGILTVLATSSLARALTEAEEGRELAARSNAALRAVVTAASASADVATDLPELLDVVATALGGIGAHFGGVVLLDPGATHLRYSATYRIPPDMVTASYPVDQGVSGEVLRTGRTVIVEDYSTSDIAVPGYRDREFGAAVGVPVRDDAGMVGVLIAARYDNELPEAGALSALELLADHAGRAIALSRRIDDDQRTLRRLETLNERQRDFVATVSHELRTPVTIVDGLAATLRDNGARLSEEKRATLLDRLVANSSSLVTIVTSLLDAARLDAGLTLDEEQVDLGELVRDSASRLAPVLSGHDVHVEVQPGALVRGDAGLLQRVVDNLLTNVERHTPPGTSVTVSVRIDHDSAVAEVADRGPGIPAGVLPQVTGRFVRGGDHRTRGTRGLGIGLSLVDQILRLHGSRLEVSTTPGGGATFAFALRLARRRAPRDGAPPDTAAEDRP